MPGSYTPQLQHHPLCLAITERRCRDDSADNSRERTVKFALDPDVLPSTLHGFAGYFEAELYKGVRISTVPATHTPGMHSWFPIFFPLVQPLRVEKGAPLVLSMWRVASTSKVLLPSARVAAPISSDLW